MRFLLALILATAPALAQQADAPPQPGDQVVQAPAKADAPTAQDQTKAADQTPAPAPAKTDAATAQDQTKAADQTPAPAPAKTDAATAQDQTKAADQTPAPAPAKTDAPTAQDQTQAPAKTDAATAQDQTQAPAPAKTEVPTAKDQTKAADQTQAPAPAKADAPTAQDQTKAADQTPAPAPAKTDAATAQDQTKAADQTPPPAKKDAPTAKDQTKAADQTAAPAASPVPANPAPAGEQWFTGSLDLGYRFVTGPAGNYPEYRSVINLGQGLVLGGLDFTIIDPKKRAFDRLDASAYGWGGEPYEGARLSARKQSVYDFLFDYRNIAFFDAVPSYANSTAPSGFNEQSFDTRRSTMTVSLDLRPGKRIIPYLVYERNSGYGHGVDEWVENSYNEFAVPILLRDSTNNYRGGVRFEFNRFHFTVEQGGTTYQDNDQSQFSGNNLGDNTAPLLGQTLSLSNLQQAYNITGKSLYSKALVTAHPFAWLDLYGQFLYSDPKTTVNFNETAAGNLLSISELVFYGSQQTIGTGAANQPHTTGTAGMELRPWKRLRIIQNWLTDRYHDAAFGMLNITTAPTPLGGISSINPLQVVNYNQEQVDVLLDVTSKLTLHGGYRYVWGDATTPATPFLNAPGTEESGQLKRNVWIGGLNFRLSDKLSLNVDYEGGDSDDIYFRDSLNNYHKGRARAKYRVLPSLTLQATASLLKNTNPAPTIQYNLLTRDTSLAVYWTPKNSKHFSLTGQYDRSTFHSTIDYLMLPFYSPAVSDYRDNGHSVTGLLDVNLPGVKGGKLSMGGSMFLSNGSNTTRYYQPLARLLLPFNKHIAWNTEWTYYGYLENFYLFESFRTHIITTGLKITR